MKAIKTRLPYENIVYFGDTARLPYGNKPPETLLRYAKENATFLKQQGIKALVIACHTASSVTFTALKEALDIPVIGITEQGVEATHRLCAPLPASLSLAILGTKATIQSQFYQIALRTKLPEARLLPIACPLFVPLVEEGFIAHPLTQLAIRETLKALEGHPVHALLLACTHYPLLENALREVLGPSCLFIDPAMACAEQVEALLKEQHLLNPSRTLPQYRFYVSDDPAKFKEYGHLFFNPIEELYQT